MLDKLLAPFVVYLPENNRLERIWKLAIIDYKKRYYNDALGILWALIHPVFMLIVYYTVFTVLFNSTIEHFPLYLFCGLLVWMFFTEGTTKGITILSQKRYLIENIPFEKKDLFLSATLSVFFGFCFNLLAYLAMSLIFGVFLQKIAFIFPLLLLNTFIIVMAVAMILATISIYLKDIRNLWDMVLLAGFWSTPIFWDQNMLLNSKLEFLLYLNPIAGIILNMRQVILYGELPILFWLVYDLLFGGLLLIFAIWLFDTYSHKAAEKL